MFVICCFYKWVEFGTRIRFVYFLEEIIGESGAGRSFRKSQRTIRNDRFVPTAAVDAIGRKWPSPDGRRWGGREREAVEGLFHSILGVARLPCPDRSELEVVPTWYSNFLSHVKTPYSKSNCLVLIIQLGFPFFRCSSSEGLSFEDDEQKQHSKEVIFAIATFLF